MPLPVYRSLSEIVKAVQNKEVHVEARFAEDQVELFDAEAAERLYTCSREEFIAQAIDIFGFPRFCAAKKEVRDEVCYGQIRCDRLHGHPGAHVGTYPGLEDFDQITKFHFTDEAGHLQFKRNHSMKQSFIVPDQA